MEDVSVYCGPFLHIVNGNHFHSHSGGTGEYGLNERTNLGAYVGAQIELADNKAVTVEYQRTSDAWALAGGVTIRF